MKEKRTMNHSFKRLWMILFHLLKVIFQRISLATRCINKIKSNNAYLIIDKIILIIRTDKKPTRISWISHNYANSQMIIHQKLQIYCQLDFEGRYIVHIGLVYKTEIK